MDDGLGFMVGVSACVGVKGEGEVHECDMHAEYTTPVYTCSRLSYLHVDKYAGTHHVCSCI